MSDYRQARCDGAPLRQSARDLRGPNAEAGSALPPLCGLGFPLSTFLRSFEVSSRILVVDDDLQQRRSLSAGLRLEGFSPIEASGGEEAMRLLESQTVDLVITDLMMPGLNGLHFVRRLHARLPDMPVILTSGYHLGRKQIERAGLRVLAFVPKPYDLAELARFLHGNLIHSATG